MYTLLNYVWINTILATIAALILFPVYKVLYKKTLTWRSALLWLVLLRFILPVEHFLNLNFFDLLQPYSGGTTNVFEPFALQELAHFSTLPEQAVARVNTNDFNGVALLFFVWLLGITLFIGIFYFKRFRVAKRINSARPLLDKKVIQRANSWKAKLKIKRPIQLKISSEEITAYTLGTWRPVIVISQKVVETKPLKYLEAVIAHELAHIKHFDDLKLQFIAWVRALHFFNPLAWLIAHRMDMIREFNCDKAVLQQQHIKPIEYGKVLLDATRVNRQGVLFYLLAMAVSKNSLTKRFIMIKGVNMKHSTPSKSMAFILSILAIVIISMKMPENDIPVLAPVQVVETPMLSAAPTAPRATLALEEITFINPLQDENYKISSSYGWRINPFTKKKKMHIGIDLKAKMDTPVQATAAGVVVFSGEKGNYGNLVIIKHAEGFTSQYGQLNKCLVEKGREVKAGDVIGRVGSSGRSTGPHLHFELIKDNKRVNPAEYILF